MQACGWLVARLREQDVDRNLGSGIEPDGGIMVPVRDDLGDPAIDDFSVLTADGESLRARRLILSYGVVDQMPDVPGFAEGWGTSIVPCPYSCPRSTTASWQGAMAGIFA